MKRRLFNENIAASCYFRSSVEQPYRKALLQITERCNLFCAHCFVSSGNYGDVMELTTIQEIVIPRLEECRVISITLTGGEPFTHPKIIEIIKLLRASEIEVSICTNATLITLEQMESLSNIGKVRLNVSLDGFRPQSHGKFRGDKNSFLKTIETINLLGRYRLLKGLLVTTNNLAEIEEYAEICDLAINNEATYVLMNPLSNFGRGTKSMKKLSSSNQTMRQIREVTSIYTNTVELVNIRFPNDSLPLSACEAGNIIYVFVRGELTVCPYLVFAAKVPNSQHKVEEFIVGNIFRDSNIAQLLDKYKFYERYHIGDNLFCKNCEMNSKCGKGCPAAVIASGQHIEGIDQEMCPVVCKKANIAISDALN